MSNIKRLEKLVRGLKTRVDPQRFSLSTWAQDLRGSPYTCGCAVAWGCTFPSLNREGLHPIKNGPYKTPYYQGHVGWDTVREFFELEGDDALWLFTPAQYMSPTLPNVIARLELFIKKEKERAKVQIPDTYAV